MELSSVMHLMIRVVSWLPMFCFGLAAIGIFAVCISFGLTAFLFSAAMNRQELHDAALPVIAVAFAGAVFPLQSAAVHAGWQQRYLTLTSVLMFVGSFQMALAYFGYWGLTTLWEIDPSAKEAATIVAFLALVMIAIALLAFVLWFIGVLGYLAFYAYISGLWVQNGLITASNFESENDREQTDKQYRDRVIKDALELLQRTPPSSLQDN